MPKASKQKSLIDILDSHILDSGGDSWSGTLRDYIKIVSDSPDLHMGAHKRVLRMIESHGVEKDDEDNITSYNFFKDDLFGIDDAIQNVVEYLRAAATGSEVGRRILLMYGPTSSGKSQFAICLKRGLEKFSNTEDGAIYALSESPMYEDPLWAIPEDLREEFLNRYKIKINGDLSPYMRLILKEKYNNNFLDLPVKRIFVSEKDRTCIGTFVPSDKKSQDISELVGSMDLSMNWKVWSRI